MEDSTERRDILKYEELIRDSSVLSRVYPPTDNNIKECANFLKKGGIVGMPTETVYGPCSKCL